MAEALSAQQGQAAARLRQGRQQSAPPLKLLNVQDYSQAGNQTTSAAARLSSRRQAALRLPQQTVKAAKGKQAFKDAKQTTNPRAARRGLLNRFRAQAKQRRDTNRVNKAIGAQQKSMTDPMEQTRLMLDRLFAGKIATLAGIPLALGLAAIRGIATLPGAQSLPTRHIRYTEKSYMAMLGSIFRKVRPFTFTERDGKIIGVVSIIFIFVLFILSLLPLLMIVAFVTGMADAVNPFN